MIYELSNSLTKTLITKLRNQRCDAVCFRQTIRELTKQLVYEALKDFALAKKEVTTWRGESNLDTIDESNLMVVTVLRAGMPMLDSAMDLLSEASAGFLAIKRDESTHKQSSEYFSYTY